MNEQEKGRGGGGEQSASQLSQSTIRKPPPAPVVVYMVPPKVIHADASEFMAVVQRLTGSNNQEVEEDRGRGRETTRGRGEEVREDLGSTGVVEDYHELNFMSRDDQEDGTRGAVDVGGSSFFDAFSKKEN